MIAIIVLLVVIAAAGVVLVIANRGPNRTDRATLLLPVHAGLGVHRTDGSLPEIGHGALLGDATMSFNVAYGALDGRATWVFDADSVVGDTTRCLSGAVVRIGGALPDTTIVGRSMIPVLGQPPRLSVIRPSDPQVASTVDIRSNDPEFVESLLTAAVASFFAQFGDELAFELAGDHVLCVSSRVEPARLPLLVKAVLALIGTAPAPVLGEDRAA